MRQLLSFCFIVCISSLSAQEIYLSTLGNSLFRLDLSDCSYVQVGAMPVSSTDISFHPNGNLYSISGTGILYEIDPLNGTSSQIYVFEASGSSQLYTALTISAEGIFYACGLNGDLYAYNLATNSGSYLGNVGYGAEGDLTFYQGELYMAAEGDNIVQVNIDNPSASIVEINGNVPGRIFGIVSFANSCDDISVYALTDNAANIYEVNFENNSLDLYCSIPLEVSGGASTFEFLGSNPIDVQDVNTAGFTCGSADGSIVVNAGGGVGTLTYSLDGVNFQNNPVFNNLPVASYTVYVTDDVGCTVTEEVMISGNLPTIDDVIVTNVSCGMENGQIEIVVEGGVAPYQFFLNGELATNGLLATGLATGAYQLELVDAAGCVANSMATVNTFALPMINNLMITPANCGQANGQFSFQVNGGMPPYEYVLNGQMIGSDPLATDLAAGDYLLLAIDATGCSTPLNVTIVDEEPLIDEVTFVDTSCGENNGSITLSVSGGAMPYRYRLNGGSLQSDNTFSGLSPGNYDVEIVDAANCMASTTATIAEGAAIALDTIVVTPSRCGLALGAIEVVASGAGSLIYTLNGSAAGLVPEATFANLSGGTYNLLIQDVGGCTISRSVTIADTPAPVLGVTAVTATNCLEEDGTISWQSSGGSGVLELRLNGIPVFEKEMLTGLPAGTQELLLVDSLGCTDSLMVEIFNGNCPIYLPNVFSPNQDGINDRFGPQSAPGNGIKILRFQVFDRWGGLVFEQKGGALTDNSRFWDGRRQGEVAVAGVYVYFLELQQANGTIEILSGDVVLIR